ENPAVRAVGVEVSDRRDEHDVGVLQIYRDAADMLRIVEPQVGPGLSGVRRLVDTVRETGRVSKGRFAASDVDRIGGGRRHRDRADGGDGLIIEDGLPDPAAVDRLPEPAVHRARVELLRTPGYAGDRIGPATAEGAEHAPLEAR